MNNPPPPGKYRLFLPMLAIGMDVIVTPSHLRTPIGDFPWDQIGGLWGGGQVAIECTGTGTYIAVVGALNVAGTCIGPLP